MKHCYFCRDYLNVFNHDHQANTCAERLSRFPTSTGSNWRSMVSVISSSTPSPSVSRLPIPSGRFPTSTPPASFVPHKSSFPSASASPLKPTSITPLSPSSPSVSFPPKNSDFRPTFSPTKFLAKSLAASHTGVPVVNPVPTFQVRRMFVDPVHMEIEAVECEPHHEETVDADNLFVHRPHGMTKEEFEHLILVRFMQIDDSSTVVDTDGADEE